MDNSFLIDPYQLQTLIASLQKRGFETIGPIVDGDAIVYDRISSTEELPAGWTDEQDPGLYRISKSDNPAYFGYTLPPQSWKRLLYPPSLKLFSVRKEGKTIEIDEQKNGDSKFAFIGVRPCELSAIKIQDRVFTTGEYHDDHYMSLRKKVFIVVVNCSRAGNNCFCTSMKTGPEAIDGFDISLTEIVKGNEHYFVANAGSDAGASLIKEISAAKASESEIAAAEDAVRATAAQITKSLETEGLPELLAGNIEHPHWDDVAKRCLTCANCTMVCPTCFCSTVEDSTDLSGRVAERSRRWDSCFTMDFAKVSGGNFRITPKSRYRQWLTHKLSSWVEQFGVSGCVGCGRCITWCPVGIDLTAEVRAISGAGVKQEKEG